MKILMMALALATLLAGCGGRTKYVNHDKAAAQEEQDYADCDWEASKSTAGLRDSSDREDRIKELIEKCMKSKGYKPN